MLPFFFGSNIEYFLNILIKFYNILLNKIRQQYFVLCSENASNL